MVNVVEKVSVLERSASEGVSLEVAEGSILWNTKQRDVVTLIPTTKLTLSHSYTFPTNFPLLVFLLCSMAAMLLSIE
jgi:hypothetical protein